MSTVFILDLAYAAGIAISPTPIVVVILMLFSPTGRQNAIAYLIGWIVGLAALGIVLLLLVGTGITMLEDASVISRPSIQILIGIGILFLGVRRWNVPPKENVEEAMPKWVATLDKVLSASSGKFTPRRALVLAVFMSALSPKNIALMLALFLTFAQFNIGYTQAFLLLIIFILLSSVSIGIPILYAMIKGEDAPVALNELKNWMILNRGRAVALLLFILGGIVLMNGLVDLLQKLTLA